MYTVLIDESGDVGLNGIQPDPSYGPTQYFCLCATIFQEDNRPTLESALEGLPFWKGSLHANKLSHFEKIHACRTVATLPIGMLGVVSNKLSLLNYLPRAQASPTHFYNKVMQYMLERVGHVMARLNIKPKEVRILLEARSQQYSSLLSFLEAIQNKPLDTRATLIRHIDRFSISSISKSAEKCMALSDLGANAIFSVVRRDAKAFGLSENRYLAELGPVFLAGRDGRILPNGLKPIHSISDLGVPTETSDFLQTFKNQRKEYYLLS